MKLIEAAILILCSTSLTAAAQNPDQQNAQPKSLLQSPGVPAGLQAGRYPLYALMDNPKVLKELNLTEEQLVDCKAMRKKQLETRTAWNKDLSAEKARLSEKVRQSKRDNDDEALAIVLEQFEAVEKQQIVKATEMGEFNDRQVAKLLNRDQKKRLEEIHLQAEGPEAFKDEKLQTALGLEPDQITEIKRVLYQYSRQLRTAAKLPTGAAVPKVDSPETPEKKANLKAVENTQSNMATARVETMKAIEQVLTKAQRNTYLLKVGRPFSFLGKSDPEGERKGEKANSAQAPGSGQ